MKSGSVRQAVHGGLAEEGDHDAADGYLRTDVGEDGKGTEAEMIEGPGAAVRG